MKIQIDGVDHELDVQAAAKAGCLKQVAVHRVGNRYSSFDGNIYVLTYLPEYDSEGEQVDGPFYVTLVNIRSGTVWNNKIKVGNIDKLTDPEWFKLDSFRLLKFVDAYEF